MQWGWGRWYLELTGSLAGACSPCSHGSKIRMKWQETQACPWLGAEEKLRSLFVGPSLPVLMVPMTTLACSLSSLCPAVPTFPPQCLFGPLISGARSPPRCSLRGGQPNSLGISCHCGQEPRRCLLPGQPQYSGSLPHPQVGLREVREVGKGTQIPNVAELGTVPKTPDSWAMVSPGADAQTGLSALSPALW